MAKTQEKIKITDILIMKSYNVLETSFFCEAAKALLKSKNEIEEFDVEDLQKQRNVTKK